MAFVVSAVVVSVGATIGASALALGTIAGVSVGGIIGAGIAGGILAEVKGGDFWDGFVTAGVGYGVFSGINANFGGADPSAGAGGSYGGEFAGDSYLNTAGDSFGGVDGASPGYFGQEGITGEGLGGVPTEMGMGEYGTRAPIEDIGSNYQYSTIGQDGGGPAPMQDYVPVNQGAPDMAAPSVGGAQAQAMAPAEVPGTANQFGATTYGYGANPTEGFSTTTTAPGGSDFTYNPNQVGGSLENLGTTQPVSGGSTLDTGWEQQDYSLGSGGSNSGSGFGPTMGSTSNAGTTSSGGLGSMFKGGDAWLGENLGLPKGSTAMLGMQGASSLYDMYQAQELKDRAAGMQPMSFDDYMSKHGNLAGYRSAGRALGRAGRTGALPVLLARQKSDVGKQYATNYLPGAQQVGWSADMAARNAAAAGPRNLASTLSSLYMLGNRG